MKGTKERMKQGNKEIRKPPTGLGDGGGHKDAQWEGG